MSIPQLCAELGLRPCGRIAPRRPCDIAGSRIGVGFETLERRHFDPERCYAPLAELGAKWARVQTGWNLCEPEPGRYDFAWLDAVVDNLRAIGVQPFFSLSFGNVLYTPDAPHPSARGRVPLYYGQEAINAWCAYVQALTRHFADRVQHWEIWNEPNANNFWLPGPPDPVRYMELLALTAPIVRAAVPQAVIIGGAFSCPNPWWKYDFIEACFVQGMGRWIDAVSFHPYNAIPERGYRSEVAVLRRLIAAHAPGCQLWQGECGCPSRDSGLGEFRAIAGLDETKQAKWALRRLLIDLSLDLDHTQYFHLVDLFNYIKEKPTGENHYMGLLHGEDYTPKPSYRAVQVLCAVFDDATRRADMLFHATSAPGVAPPARLDLAAIEQASFIRHGNPLYTWWYPADLGDALPPQPVCLHFWHGSSAHWDEPVLIDTLDGTIYDLTGVQREKGGDLSAVLPVADHPLLLTERQHAGDG